MIREQLPSSIFLAAVGQKAASCGCPAPRQNGSEISDDFIFEALWYGRSCFVVDSADRADRMLERFLELLEERKKVRARVAQTVHVVWDAMHPLSESQTLAFARLAKSTGFSLFVCRNSQPSATQESQRNDSKDHQVVHRFAGIGADVTPSNLCGDHMVLHETCRWRCGAGLTE